MLDLRVELMAELEQCSSLEKLNYVKGCLKQLKEIDDIPNQVLQRLDEFDEEDRQKEELTKMEKDNASKWS